MKNNTKDKTIDKLRICAYRVMDARWKFGEHERCVRVARSDSRVHSSFLSALQTSQVHPLLDIRTAKSMSKFFYNIADKNACLLINCKILITRATEKQTLLLAGYKHATIA